MRKTTIATLLCFCAALSAICGAERVSIGSFFLSKSPVTAPSMGATYIKGSEVDFDSVAGGFSYERLAFNVPLMAPYHLNDQHALILAMKYEASWLESDTLLGDVDLHDFRLWIRWMYRQPDSKWSWTALLEPGLATDGKSIDMDDLSVDGQLGVRYAKSSRLAWLGGVAWFYNSMETRIYPGIGFQWRPLDDVLVRLVGPSLKASWQTHDDWILHAGVEAAGGTWNVRNNGGDYDLKLRSYRAGVGMERRLSEKIWLGLWGGFTFSNNLEIETASGTGLFDEDADMGWFVKLGIRKILW